MGVAQLERLDEFLDRKRRIAERYAEALGNVPGVTLMQRSAVGQQRVLDVHGTD